MHSADARCGSGTSEIQQTIPDFFNAESPSTSSQSTSASSQATFSTPFLRNNETKANIVIMFPDAASSKVDSVIELHKNKMGETVIS